MRQLRAERYCPKESFNYVTGFFSFVRKSIKVNEIGAEGGEGTLKFPTSAENKSAAPLERRINLN